MTVTETTRSHVIHNYIAPARLRGEATVQVRVGNVLKELGWTNRTPSVFSTLSSQIFQREAGVELIEKRGGSVSGGPSTTVQFVYRLKPESETAASAGVTAPPSRGLEALFDLFGIFKEEFKALGGAEAFMQAERDAWGPEPWERLEKEARSRIAEER